jgi:hypothetical protein
VDAVRQDGWQPPMIQQVFEVSLEPVKEHLRSVQPGRFGVNGPSRVVATIRLPAGKRLDVEAAASYPPFLGDGISVSFMCDTLMSTKIMNDQCHSPPFVNVWVRQNSKCFSEARLVVDRNGR